MKTVKRDRQIDMNKEQRERKNCIVDILTGHSRPAGLHTSGTE